VRRRLVPLIALALALLGLVSAGAGGQASTPTASANALAIKVIVPNQAGLATQAVTSPPAGQPAATGAFQFPADGSAVSAASTTASAVTTVQKNASAKSESDVTQLSFFGGEITADAITARTSAGTGPSGAGGNANGSAVVNLKVTGQPAVGTRIALGDWGQLTVGAQTIDRTAAAGTKAYKSTVVELDIRLTADHGGLPVGSEIQVG